MKQRKYVQKTRTVPVDELILSNQNPTTILELENIKGNTAVYIKLSNNLGNDKMELSYGGSKIQSLLQCITIFTDNNFTEVVKLNVNNFTVTLPSSVSLYKYLHCDKEISKLTFRAQNSQSIGCFFQNTVFQLSNLKRKYLSMIFDRTGLCEIMLINLPGQYGIKTIWTNSKKDNIVLKNALDNSTLISFNATTASLLKNIKLNSVSYIITMPANVSILIEFFYASKKIELQPDSLSFYETPLYGSPNLKPQTDLSTYLLLRSSIFIVTALNISPSAVLQINAGNTVTDIKSLNESITITNSIAFINYSEPEIGFKGAIIHIKSFDHRYSQTKATTFLSSLSQGTISTSLATYPDEKDNVYFSRANSQTTFCFVVFLYLAF